MRHLQATLLALLLALVLTLPSTTALASSIALVVTDAGGGTQIGNDVGFGPGGGSVTYDIVLDATEPFSGIAVSATFPGASGTGTAPPALADGPIVIPLYLGGPLPGDDAMGQWAFQSATVALGVGSYTLGTITVTTAVATTVTIGVLTGSDGFLDAFQGSIPLSAGTAQIGVVPEPGTALLLGLGLARLAARRGRR